MVTEHAKERARQRMGIRQDAEAILPQLWRAGRVATKDDLLKFWYMRRCEERAEQRYRVVMWRGRAFLFVVERGRLITVIERPN